ncbi:MAG: L-serine ammonia-lyase, iron-sulfur-dependent, subunit beta [Cyanobacteria bacterium SIG28]|nr:L-serine ammonia-lyase, iron-sulfur-dependent, subunit beta [Cyanobacteria bacterium SIG28]
MKKKTLFDVIGPIIIGPSSSHTAGAARLGYLAGKIYGELPKKIHFKLYNSFAKTGKGHGTDKGLLGGVIGLSVDNPQIRNVFELAKQSNIDFSFEFLENFSRHPNSVDFIFDGNNGKMEISGASLGGGDVIIDAINGYKFNINGNYPTLLLIYKDKPGMIYNVTVLIQKQNINIASMNCQRKARGEEASMAIYLDSPLNEETLKELSKIDEIYFIRSLEEIC